MSKTSRDSDNRRSRPSNLHTSGGHIYSRISLDALLNDFSRASQPHLHPKKLNGALWFGIDRSVNIFIRKTWKSYFMGPWKSWKYVPDERINIWWKFFVQNYNWESRFHDKVYLHGKKATMASIIRCINKRKRKKIKPKYIGEDDWSLLLYHCEKEEALNRQSLIAASRIYDSEGKQTHNHSAGRTEFTVVEVEQAATHMTSEGSSDIHSETDSSATAPYCFLQNEEYVKHGQSSKRHIYGLDIVQNLNITPAEIIPSSFNASRNVEMCIRSLKTNFNEINNSFKRIDVIINKMLKLLEINLQLLDQIQRSVPQAITNYQTDPNQIVPNATASTSSTSHNQA